MEEDLCPMQTLILGKQVELPRQLWPYQSLGARSNAEDCLALKVFPIDLVGLVKGCRKDGKNP
jgi:hypothetical protein